MRWTQTLTNINVDGKLNRPEDYYYTNRLQYNVNLVLTSNDANRLLKQRI